MTDIKANCGRWTNNAESIFVEELGAEEHEKRLSKQDELFRRAGEKGNVLDNAVINWKKATLSLETAQNCLSAVGAQGFARVVDELDLPPNDFFQPGRLFEIRARHCNFPDTTDDTSPCVRMLAVKFADHEERSPFDLICYTGSVCPAFNANAYSDMLRGLRGDNMARKKYLLSLPIYLDAQIRGLRHLPDSYYHQHYYNQSVYEFKTSHGDQWLAKFRIIPADGSEESGLIPEEKQRELWDLNSAERSSLQSDYLRKQFTERLQRGGVDYTLQIQLHPFYDDGTIEHSMYNPSTEWPDKDHPWRYVMNINLMSDLPTDVTQETYFNIFNHPKDVLHIPEPKTQYDFNIIAHLRAGLGNPALALKDKRKSQGSGVQYNITVVTGIKKGSATDDVVSVSIIGSKGRTSFRKLDYFLEDDFEKGSSRLYRIVDIDVHDIVCVKIHKEPGPHQKSDWFLNYVTVYSSSTINDKKIYIFPCYRWLTNNAQTVTLQEGKGVLPQSEDNPYLKLQRQLEIQDRREEYQWRKRGVDPGFKDFPGYFHAGDNLDLIPRDVRLEGQEKLETECIRLNEAPGAGRFKNAVEDVLSFMRREDPFEEKASLLKTVAGRTDTLDHVLAHWQEDEEFGRQILQGVNPSKLIQIGELPENFPVTEEDVSESFLNDASLAEEMKAGKVYMLSYPELDDFITQYDDKQRYMCAPICLLYVRDNKLVPIAIQLTQTPSQHTPIFTQKDNNGKYSDWLVAKIWVRMADTNYHQLITRLLGTHLVMEPVAITMMRNLPSMHPVFKLLLPHLQSVIASNTLIRKFLLPHGKALPRVLALAEEPCAHLRLIAKAYQDFSWSSLNLPQTLETRGVIADSLLPEFLYRDDALLIWDVIEDFIYDIMNHYYKTDADVEIDTDLNDMMTDLTTNGFHENVNIPQSFKKKEELVQFLTSVIFCSSCQHAAVSSGQMNTYGFVPNSPTCLMMPPPKCKDTQGVDEAAMRKLLPSTEISQQVIRLASLSTKCTKTEVHLGHYPDKHFTDAEAQAAIGRFQTRLKDVSAAIQERNKRLDVPYSSLLPDRVPNCMTI